MQRSRVTITINQTCLKNLDNYIHDKKARNRSQAIENIVSDYFSFHINQAVILAGGQGTKMRPFTYEVPKSLLPINGRPLLYYLIESLRKAKIYDITICLGYLGDKIKQYFGDGKRFGVNIRYFQESAPLLTGGALAQAKKYINNDSFILLNGDIVADVNLQDVIDFHLKEKPLATLALTIVDAPQNYGQLALHGIKLVNFFRPKDKKENSHLVNTGIYILSPEIFQYFPKGQKKFLIEDIITELILQKKANGFVFEGRWFDVGTPETYTQAIKAFK